MAVQVEKDEDFIKAVVQLGATAEDIVKANNTVDIYEEYFAGRQVGIIRTTLPLC